MTSSASLATVAWAITLESMDGSPLLGRSAHREPSGARTGPDRRTRSQMWSNAPNGAFRATAGPGAAVVVRPSVAAALGRDAAPHRRGRGAEVGVGVDLDARDPLDPLKAAVAGDDEPARRPVAVGQGLVADVGGEQQVARV